MCFRCDWKQSTTRSVSSSFIVILDAKAAFTPAQHVAASNMLRATSNMLLVNINYVAEIEATSCGQEATCCPQHVARRRNMLRWCKGGFTNRIIALTDAE